MAVDAQQTVKFKVTDALGNAVKGSSVDFKLDKRPAGSTSSLTAASGTTDAKGEASTKFTPDKAGEYKVKATVNGTAFSATVTLNAQPFGTVKKVAVGLERDRVSIKSNYTTAGVQNKMTLTVDLFDENDVKKAAAAADVQLVSSDVSLATVSGFVVKADEKDKRGVVTITAIHKNTGVSGSVQVPVVGPPASIAEDVSVSDKTASVTLQFVDADGNKTWEDLNYDTLLTVIAPSGVTVSERKDFAKGTGKASFKAVAGEYGTYAFTAVAPNGLAKTFSVTFGAPKPAVPEVIMFIGSASFVKGGQPAAMDVAPFIENGRTFVPVRFIGEAFGAELDWTPKDAATEKVFITRDDIQVTITIGSNVIQVVRDGVPETVTADVAAFIKDGRTFLPLRAIGEIFGAEFDWGPKDAATEWVKFW